MHAWMSRLVRCLARLLMMTAARPRALLLLLRVVLWLRGGGPDCLPGVGDITYGRAATMPTRWIVFGQDKQRQSSRWRAGLFRNLVGHTDVRRGAGPRKALEAARAMKGSATAAHHRQLAKFTPPRRCWRTSSPDAAKWSKTAESDADGPHR